MSPADEGEVQAKKKASNSNPQTPRFLEVMCKGTGKVRRFAAGTEAGFALSSINWKLGSGNLPALHIEAFKEGEEPVIFGPTSVLVDYGDGWNLQAVPNGDYEESKTVKPTVKQYPAVQNLEKREEMENKFNGPWTLEQARLVREQWEQLGFSFPACEDADRGVAEFLNMGHHETEKDRSVMSDSNIHSGCQMASTDGLLKNRTHSDAAIDSVVGKGNTSTQGIGHQKSNRDPSKNGVKAVPKENAYAFGHGLWMPKKKKKRVNLKKAFWKSTGFDVEDSCDSDVEQGFWWGDEWITEWDDFSNPYEIEVGGPLVDMSSDEIVAIMLSKRRERIYKQEPFFALGDTFFGSLDEPKVETARKKTQKGKLGPKAKHAKNKPDFAADVLCQFHDKDIQAIMDNISDEEKMLITMLAMEGNEDALMHVTFDILQRASSESKPETSSDKIPKEKPGTMAGLKKGFLGRCK